MTTIESTVDVDAPPSRVWTVLTDFESYPEWNRFLPLVSGRAEAGRTLRVRVEPPGARGMTFRPRVLAADPGRRLAWLGRLVVPGLFDGRHEFLLEEREGGSRLVQRETFSGLLVRVLLDADATRAGFEAMNAALKARAERPATAV
ncbi:MAG: SRPBCC family protein [Halobacteriaceae archaeon]